MPPSCCSPAYRRHLESLRKKLTSQDALLRWLAGSGWGAGVTTVRTATLALMHSTAEYCAPVWYRIAYTRLIDPAINDAVRIVTGCLRPTPADNLPILSGIQPTELRRNGATLSLARRVWSLNICSTQRSPIHRVQMHGASNRDTHLYLSHNNSSVYLTTTTYVRRSGRMDHQWNVEWADNPARLRTSITGTHPHGMTLLRRAWVRLNRLRTAVGRFRSCLYKWGMASSAACECGAEEQTVDHVVLQCPIHRLPHGLHGLTVLDDETNGCSTPASRSSAA